ncbi:hypothetical protein DVH05_008747 [Phytophthora capsici]|nr:hypothetical protein DVH05_008747 [Phytophthora capsici]
MFARLIYSPLFAMFEVTHILKQPAISKDRVSVRIPGHLAMMRNAEVLVGPTMAWPLVMEFTTAITPSVVMAGWAGGLDQLALAPPVVVLEEVGILWKLEKTAIVK